MCDASWGQLTFRRLHSLNIECMSVRLSMISVSELTDPFSKFKTLIFEVNNKRTNAFIFPQRKKSLRRRCVFTFTCCTYVNAKYTQKKIKLQKIVNESHTLSIINTHSSLILTRPKSPLPEIPFYIFLHIFGRSSWLYQFTQGQKIVGNQGNGWVENPNYPHYRYHAWPGIIHNP